MATLRVEDILNNRLPSTQYRFKNKQWDKTKIKLRINRGKLSLFASKNSNHYFLATIEK